MTRAEARNKTTTIKIGNDCPGQLDLRAAVDLGRLPAGIRRSLTELHEAIDDQRKNNGEDDSRDHKYKDGQVGD